MVLSTASVCPPEPWPGPAPRSGRTGVPGLRARWLPYGVAAALFVLFMIPICVRLPWCGDIGQHAATIWRLRENLRHPSSPMVDVPGDGSPYFTPYTVFGALLCRATGWTPLRALHVLALGNVLLITVGVAALVRALTARIWAPVFALACYVLLWGLDPRLWSGYESLLSLAFGICYPSAFAAGTAMLTMAWTLRLLGRVPGATREPRQWHPARRWAEHGGLGLLAATVLLSHLFTGVPMLLGVLGMLIGSWEALSLRDRARWALSTAVGGAVVLLWPYWSVLDLHQDASLDAVHRWLYVSLVPWIGLALLVGVPALAIRFRRDHRDPLVLLFLSCGAAVAYGWFSGHYSWGRLTPGAVLAAQLAAAVELARLPWRRAWRTTFVPTAALALLLGAWIQAGAALLALPAGAVPPGVAAVVRHVTPWTGYSWLSPYLHYGDVVMTRDVPAVEMLAAYGYYTVRAGYPDPAVPAADLDRRATDTTDFFAPTTPDRTRQALLRRYHAAWILTTHPGTFPPGAEYRVTAHHNGEYLIHSQPPSHPAGSRSAARRLPEPPEPGRAAPAVPSAEAP